MTTSITLPEQLAERLQQQARARRLSAEALAAAYIEAGLTEDAMPAAEQPVSVPEEDPELLTLVERVKAMPWNSANIIPAKGDLAEVLRALEAMEPEEGYDLEAEIAALDAAEMELRAMNRADDSADG